MTLDAKVRDIVEYFRLQEELTRNMAKADHYIASLQILIAADPSFDPDSFSECYPEVCLVTEDGTNGAKHYKVRPK